MCTLNLILSGKLDVAKCDDWGMEKAWKSQAMHVTF